MNNNGAASSICGNKRQAKNNCFPYSSNKHQAAFTASNYCSLRRVMLYHRQQRASECVSVSCSEHHLVCDEIGFCLTSFFPPLDRVSLLFTFFLFSRIFFEIAWFAAANINQHLPVAAKKNVEKTAVLKHNL